MPGGSDETLRRALSYRRFQAEPRVLLLDSGYHGIADIIEGARSLGWAVFPLPTQSHGTGKDSFIIDLLTALCTHRPDYVLSLNFRGFDEEGVLSQLFASYGVLHASWFLDHPLPILGGCPKNANDLCQVFCIEKSALPFLCGLGFRDPLFLPSASSRRFHPDRIDPSEAQALGHPLCFVGQSWWGIAREDPLPAVRDLALALLGKRNVDAAYVRGDLLREIETWPMPLGCEQRLRYRVAYVALAEASLLSRAGFLRSLQPLSVHVYGDPFWQQLLGDVPSILCQRHVNPLTELPAVFAGSSVNLNITAVALPTALNLRVWEVPGVGAFLLTDRREDLFEFFRSDEVAVYSDLEEARDLSRYYLMHEEERQAIARRAFLRVERCHRYEHRLVALDRVMRARFG